MLAELTVRLSLFPALHGDEAWLGLAAWNGSANNTLHGMNSYTGSLFSRMVAAQFSLSGASVFSLRLPGAVCNGAAMILIAAILWRRGQAAFFALLLFASSLLFLFYSRVAWEVSALQNLLLALILAALDRLLSRARPATGWSFLFYAAFALGMWNHFIFLAAAISLTAASTFLLLRRPDETTARLFALTILNLALLGVMAGGLVLTPDGDFITHGLPALLIGLVLVMATSAAFARYEPRLSSRLALFPRRNEKLARRFGLSLGIIATAGLLFCLPLDGVSFLGTLTGFILEARVTSYLPSFAEGLAQHAAVAILLASFVLVSWHLTQKGGEAPILPILLLFWTILFFPALRLETQHAPDRYFIIPQFLFFCALATAVEHLTLPWRRMVQAAMAFLFLFNQQFFWRSVAFPSERAPLNFHYGLYEDTSRHFMTLTPLRTYLSKQGNCAVQSPSYFIAQPLRFLAAVEPACRGVAAAHIDYCDSCRQPVQWFLIRPVPPERSSSK